MGLAESFNLLGLSVVNTFLSGMDYDIVKHSSYETRKGNFGVPLAYGAHFGDIFGGTSIVSDPDHAIVPYNPIIGFGFGLGDAQQSVGFESVINIGSVNPFGGESVAHDAYYGFKLHRRFFLNNSISVGAEDFISRGRDKNFYGSYYLNTTQLFPIANTLFILTIGVGTGRFYTSSYFRVSDGEQLNEKLTPLGVFGSVIYSFSPNFALQFSSSVEVLSAFLFINPLFFADLKGFMCGLGLMDISRGLIKSNFNLTVTYSLKI